jgi:hypothetical protein
MDLICKDDLILILKKLNLTPQSYPAVILTKILTANVENDINPQLFFKYFYSSIDSIKNEAIKYIDSINRNSCPFQVIHGYSKNGKTTFLHYIQYANNNNYFSNKYYKYSIISFDFEKYTGSNYVDKIIDCFLNEFDYSDIKKLEAGFFLFENFIKFFRKFSNKLYSSNNQYYELVNFFEGFCKYLINSMENIINLFRKDKEKQFNNIRGYIKNMLENKNVDIQNNCGDIIGLLILYKIFLKRYDYFTKSNLIKKYIILLDNIDDYLENKDFIFLQHPQIKLSSFIYKFIKNSTITSIFSECLKEGIYNPFGDFSFVENINITYVFRTANFFAFSNLIKDSLKDISNSYERNFPKCLLSQRYFKFNSIKYTNKIIKKRLNIFDQVMDKFTNISPPNGYKFLRTLTDEFKYYVHDSDYSDRKSIFSLWNGDYKIFWDSIFNEWPNLEEDFFPYESLIEKSLAKDFYANKFLLKGVFIYLFLYLFEKYEELEGMINIIYYYRRYYKKEKNIRRFILNYVINVSERNGHPKSISEIREKGIGLFDLLEDISDFIDKINNLSHSVEMNEGDLYNFEYVKSFFNDTYNKKLDFGIHLFTIYKSQILSKNKETFYTNYYNLERELNKYKKYRDLGKSYRCKDLNNIRIYNNDNAAFLSSYLMSHFELYSFCCSHDTEEGKRTPPLRFKKPLLFSIKRIGEYKDNLKEPSFEFVEIINNVYENTYESVNGMVKFYLNYLSKEYPPEKFIKNDYFSVLERKKSKEELGDFQFRVHISRHITYLESFRRGLMDEVLFQFKDKKEKALVNIFIAKIIGKYIKLFNDNYDLIQKSPSKIPKNHKLTDTYNSFTNLSKKIKIISDSNGFRFDVAITL